MTNLKTVCLKRARDVYDSIVDTVPGGKRLKISEWGLPKKLARYIPAAKWLTFEAEFLQHQIQKDIEGYALRAEKRKLAARKYIAPVSPLKKWKNGNTRWHRALPWIEEAFVDPEVRRRFAENDPTLWVEFAAEWAPQVPKGFVKWWNEESVYELMLDASCNPDEMTVEQRNAWRQMELSFYSWSCARKREKEEPHSHHFVDTFSDTPDLVAMIHRISVSLAEQTMGSYQEHVDKTKESGWRHPAGHGPHQPHHRSNPTSKLRSCLRPAAGSNRVAKPLRRHVHMAKKLSETVEYTQLKKMKKVRPKCHNNPNHEGGNGTERFPGDQEGFEQPWSAPKSAWTEDLLTYFMIGCVGVSAIMFAPDI
ncbi:hypothetical protein EDC01DRAFT_634107 [Geopyxis carbonaria]|nr:hypothetical protein EDC01DRAFT_634107 [Geopyxis carbonaria]